MIQLALRMAKRFAILLPGIVIAYFSVRSIFPYFDQRLPIALAIFATYVLGAYVLIPAFIRLFRIVRPPRHQPHYCVTPDGFASDPLNIGIITTRRELIQAMEKAGWHVADRNSIKNLARSSFSTAYGWSYAGAPVSSLYLFGRKQDVAFELAVKGSPGMRHHVRFWATTYEKGQPLDFHAIHWHHRKSHVQGDNLLWVGAASQDVGIGYIRHNLQITHMIDPDTDAERQLIVGQLSEQDLVKKVEAIKLELPYRLINRVINGSLHADGKMAIVTLKAKHAAAKE
ncbi:MAG TPA: LssY C-terminal domain-containing protein [Methylomirabilota bacterium]|nr:LssY C-terminal domain-containing protein [Methylomirabilota bacterium]